MTAPQTRLASGALKAAVLALADGSLTTAEIAARVGTSKASVNAQVQRLKPVAKTRRHGRKVGAAHQVQP